MFAIRDLKYLLRGYEKIQLINYDTNEVKDINEYKQQGRVIRLAAPVMYVLGTATVFYTNNK